MRRRMRRTMTKPCPPSKVKVQVSSRPKMCPCWRQCPWGRKRFSGGVTEDRGRRTPWP